MMVCHSIINSDNKRIAKKILKKSKKNQVIWRQIIEEKIIRP